MRHVRSAPALRLLGCTRNSPAQCTAARIGLASGLAILWRPGRAATAVIVVFSTSNTSIRQRALQNSARPFGEVEARRWLRCDLPPIFPTSPGQIAPCPRRASILPALPDDGQTRVSSLLKNLRRTANGPGRLISARSKLNGIPEAVPVRPTASVASAVAIVPALERAITRPSSGKRRHSRRASR